MDLVGSGGEYATVLTNEEGKSRFAAYVTSSEEVIAVVPPF